MSNTRKCPVCGNPGISDYLNEDIVCPNCNSDLKVYHSLHSVAENSKYSGDSVSKFKKLSWVLSILLLAVLIMGTYAFISYNSKVTEYASQLEKANNQVKMLNDSIKSLSSLMETKYSDATNNNHYVEYTIVSNDSPWKIVRKFYGKRDDWEEISRKIAESNNIWNKETNEWMRICPGQVIKINNFK